jgi:hypothetical protein
MQITNLEISECPSIQKVRLTLDNMNNLLRALFGGSAASQNCPDIGRAIPHSRKATNSE